MDLNQPENYPPKCEQQIKGKDGTFRKCGTNCKFSQKDGKYTDICWRHYRELKKDIPPLITLPTKKNYQILLKKMVNILSEKLGYVVSKNQVKIFLDSQNLNGKTKTTWMKDYIEAN